MKRFFTPGRIVCLLLTAALLGLAVLAWFWMSRTLTVTESLVTQHRTGVGMLTEEPVTQTFTCLEDGMTQVNVMFSNYNKKLKTGTLTLTLRDASGEVIASETMEVASLRNNAFVSIGTDRPLSSKGKTYTLSAVSDCVEQKGVTLRMGPVSDSGAAGALTLQDGSTDTQNALNLTVECRTVDYGWQPAALLVLMAVCAAAAVPFAGRKERDDA